MSGSNGKSRKSPALEVLPLKPGISSAGGEHGFMVRIVPPERETGTERPPLNLSLVLDRSGSMNGLPLENAKRAAAHVVGMLRPTDRVSIVVYDNMVDVVVPSILARDPRSIQRAIEGISARGSTDLHAGWLEGARQVAEHLDATMLNRVILLSDGMANSGVTSVDTICTDVASLEENGVSTSALGLGRGFNEDLMLAMADAGKGNFYFIETADDLASIFGAELHGISATVAKSVELEIRSGMSGVEIVEILNDLPTEDGALQLPDLRLSAPVEVGAVVRTSAMAEGEAELGSLVLRWKDTNGDSFEASVAIRVEAVEPGRFTELPENLEVASMFEELRAARAKEEATRAMDRGERGEAMRLLAGARTRLDAMPKTERIQRELADFDSLDAAMRARDDLVARKRMKNQSYRKSRSLDSDRMFATDQDRLFATGRDVLEQVVFARSDGTQGRLQLVLGDLTEEAVDAILNPTNTRLFGTGKSVDGAVHRKGGMELTRAAREIGFVAAGDTVVTPGFGLPARYVLHTAVPTWDEGAGKATKLLWSCYQSALDLANRMNLRTLAVPAIGAGTNRFPPDVAADIAVSNMAGRLQRPGAPESIRIVLFDKSLVPAYRRELQAISNRVA